MFSLAMKDTRCSMCLREENVKSFNVDSSAWLRELIFQEYGSSSFFLVVFLSVGARVSDDEDPAAERC